MIIESTALFMYTTKDQCQLVASVCMLIVCLSCISYTSRQQIFLGINTPFDRSGSNGKRSSYNLKSVTLAVNFWHFLQVSELLATVSNCNQPQRVIHNIHHLQCGLTPHSVVNGCELPSSIFPHFRSRSGKG
jgi:hypothetical protein